MSIIFLLPWLEEPENFDSRTEKCCPPIMRGSVHVHVARYRTHTFPHTMYRTRVDVKGLRTLLHLMYPGTPTFAFECGTSMYPGTPTLEFRLAKKGPQLDSCTRGWMGARACDGMGSTAMTGQAAQYF